MILTNVFVQRIIAIIIGYVVGNLAFGFFIGKMKGIDIRTQGSGGTGATNSLRTLGTGIGFLVLFLDCMKCICAALLVKLIFKGITDDYMVLMLYTCAGCCVGHDFPIILNFKGGKGVACMLGTAFICATICVPLCALIFIVTVAICRYVSLGSILAEIGLIITFAIANHMDWIKFSQGTKIEADILIIFMVALSIFLHRANIKRLINHNENKLSFKKKSN